MASLEQLPRGGVSEAQVVGVVGLRDRIVPARVVWLVPVVGRRFTPGFVRLLWLCGSGVWVLFENSTVCFVCDSAKFFVWLRPFHIPVVGVAFLKQPVCGCLVAWIVLV